MSPLRFIPLVLALVACASVPKSFSASTLSSPDEAFNCVNRETNRLGYTTLDANREAGFIRAERKVGGAGEAAKEIGRTTRAIMTGGILGGAKGDRWDELTGVLVRDVAGANTIRITAATVRIEDGGRKSSAPGDRTMNDARAVLQACGLSGTVS